MEVNGSSCSMNDKGSCSSESVKKNDINYKEHWNKAYDNKPIEELVWYETDLSPSLQLISKTGLDKSACILNVGAGSTTLIDDLLGKGYTNLIATDISDIALQGLNDRIGSNDSLDCIVDDLTSPVLLNDIDPVDLWIDRAVLHFFNDDADQKEYFKLINKKVKKNGFAIIAQFNLDGVKKCSGLDVCRYSKEMITEGLGKDFKLIEHFDYDYTMPSGDNRPFIYTLFQKM